MQETLFQELQHRVVNNMQVVASTLSTAGRGLKDRAATKVIEYAAARVRSMSKLYRQLYQPSAYEFGLETVLRDVLGEVFRGLPVTVEINVQAGQLSVRAMTAVVLLVNEAAINACKHVFCPRRGKVFSVSLREGPDGEMEMRRYATMAQVLKLLRQAPETASASACQSCGASPASLAARWPCLMAPASA